MTRLYQNGYWRKKNFKGRKGGMIEAAPAIQEREKKVKLDPPRKMIYYLRYQHLICGFFRPVVTSSA